jgi:hypothetical protein
MKTREIIMSKRGCGTVILRQGVYSDGQKWYTITAHGIETSICNADAMNRTYHSYLADNWKVKTPESEKKVASPEKPEIPKTPKPETRFIFCSESRKIWAAEFDRRKKEGIKTILHLKGEEYKTARIKLEQEIRKDMRVWEAENCAEVNKMLRQRKAEADAIQQ